MSEIKEDTEIIPNTKRKVFFGLFVFPMLIAVTMAVLLSTVVLLTHEEESPESLITAIKTGAPSKRWQKAFELSNELNKQGGMLRSAGIMNEVIHILNDREHYDAKTRAYMAMALGRFQSPEAEAALLRALEQVDDQEDPKLGIFLIWTVGNMEEALLSVPGYPGTDSNASLAVVRFLESKHDELRKTAAYVLGALGDKKVTPALKRSLEDPVIDVRWNAALSLARLGDDSGKEILLQMLDRNRLRMIQMNEVEIEQVMTNAAKALSLVQNDEARSVLEALAKTDSSLKVRQAALQALGRLQ